MAQADHGKLKWADLFGDAEHLARDGFAVPGRMADAVTRAGPEITAYAGGAKQGQILKNPAYADTMHALAVGGPRAFYEGRSQGPSPPRSPRRRTRAA